MVNKAELCEKISQIYPEFGACEQELSVNWDETNNAWAVDFELKGERIRHYLENSDAAACMLYKQCVGMGIEFGQFL